MKKADFVKSETGSYNSYDFDETIYEGDCSYDFYYYALRKKPYIVWRLLYVGLLAPLYLLRIKDKTWFKQVFFTYLRDMNGESDISDFWDRNIHKIKKFYMDQMRPDDIIISASPYQLVNEACRRIGIKNVIGTDMDMNTGKISGLNCYGQEKVVQLAAQIGDVHIEEFYSDSRSDSPMAEIADRAYMVKGEKIEPW